MNPFSGSTILWSILGLYYYLQEIYEEDGENEDQIYEYKSVVYSEDKEQCLKYICSRIHIHVQNT